MSISPDLTGGYFLHFESSDIFGKHNLFGLKINKIFKQIVTYRILFFKFVACYCIMTHLVCLYF